MVSHWIVYGVVLVLALMCQLFDVGYLVHFLLLLVLALPLVGLLLSLPAIFRCHVALSPSSPRVRRGETLAWLVTVEENLPRLSLTLVTENRMTGHREKRRLSGKNLAAGTCWREDAATHRCGKIVCRVEGVWAYDALGLFALPLRASETSEAAVCPAPEIPENLLLSQRGAVYRPAPGSGEGYELRPYRSGDSLRKIHWKASAKRGDLVVREAMELSLPPLVVGYCHGGEPELAERSLDRLAGVAEIALRRKRPMEVRWTGADGKPRCFTVEDRESWQACLGAVLSDPAPEKPLAPPPGAAIQVNGEGA